MKRWYSDCVRHFLLEYIPDIEIGTTPQFKTEAEKTNWVACHQVLATLSPQDLKLVIELYRRGDTLADKIYNLATARKTSQRYFWDLVDDVEFKIAKKRGLI